MSNAPCIQQYQPTDVQHRQWPQQCVCALVLLHQDPQQLAFEAALKQQHAAAHSTAVHGTVWCLGMAGTSPHPKIRVGVQGVRASAAVRLHLQVSNPPGWLPWRTAMCTHQLLWQCLCMYSNIAIICGWVLISSDAWQKSYCSCR